MSLIKKAEDVLRQFDDIKQNLSKEQHNSGLSIKKARKFEPPWHHTGKQLIPPFAYEGEKRDIGPEIWRRFGWDIPNYIEPFAGGLSVLLGRPVHDMRELNYSGRRELANDTNVFLLNFWRCVQQKGIEELIELVEFIGSETEVLARRKELMKRRFDLAKNIQKVDYHDPKLAAYWLYIQRQWIGEGADDPSKNPEIKMVQAKEASFIGNSVGEHLRFLQARTRYVRLFQGDWKRSLQSATQTVNIGTTGVFMDLPYIGTSEIYKGRLDKGDPADKVPLEAREWALEFGQYTNFRIAYCGYSHHHIDVFPKGKGGWIEYPWQIKNGRSTPGDDKPMEIDTVWFSPHCIRFADDPE